MQASTIWQAMSAAQGDRAHEAGSGLRQDDIVDDVNDTIAEHDVGADDIGGVNHHTISRSHTHA